MYYKFNRQSTITEEQIKSTVIYSIHEKLQNGIKWSQLSDDEKAHFHPEDNGLVKTGGWVFDFSKLLKRYWVKVKYYGIIEIYAPCKTYIRQTYPTPSHIIKIVEVN